MASTTLLAAAAASLLSLTRALTTIECSPATDLQPLFALQSTGNMSWLGADVCTSIPLDDSGRRHLYLFGDTLVGRFLPSGPNGTRIWNAMPRNSVGLLLTKADGSPLTTLSHEWRIDPKNAQHVGFFSPPNNDTQWYWPQAGLRVLNHSFVIGWRIEPANDPLFAFATAGIDVIALPTMTDSSNSPLDWPTPFPTTTFGSFISNNFTIGNAVAYDPSDGYVYLLGGQGSPASAIMARVSGDSFLAQQWGDLTFLAEDGATWVPFSSPTMKLKQLFGFVPSETTLSWVPALGAWAVITANTFLGNDITIQTAPKPYGPFSPSQNIYSIPSNMREAGAFCYAAKIHPELARSAKEFVFSYNCNTPGIPPLLQLPQIYIPSVIRAVVS